MERQYSTLELAKHDETAKAPERDYDATAFELDPDALAPQVVPDTTPQVVYDLSVPEVQGHTEGPFTERASSQNTTKATLKWLLMTVTLIVAVSVAIGAGVGTWYYHKHSHKPSPTTSPPSPHNHSFIPTAQYILNDTSLAALTLSNGDRQLFFQDITGLIRRAVRIASNGQWNTSSSLNFSTGTSEGLPVPKNNTPLTCTVFEDQYGANALIEVYYVSDNNYISSSKAEDATVYTTAYTPIYASGKNYSTAVGTRSLSIISVPGSSPIMYDFTSSPKNLAILYYENPAGNVSALLQRLVWINSSSGPSAEYQWHDITSQSSKSLPSDFLNVNPEISHTLWEATELFGSHTRLSTPFTSRANFSDTLFYAPDNGSLVFDDFLIGLQGPGNYSGFDSFVQFDKDIDDSKQSYGPIHQSDLALLDSINYIWINGTQPVTFGVAPPKISFPFTRLASANSADQKTSFLYHQINQTTLAEEQWDISEQMWLPTQYITVSES